MGGKEMTLAYIRMYLALGIGHLSILELNDLQKEIDGMIKKRCDILLLKGAWEFTKKGDCHEIRDHS
jgi:hypothetical protein